MTRTGSRRALLLTIGALLVWAMSAAPAEAAAHGTTARVVSLESSPAGAILVAGSAVYTLKPSAIGCTAACRRLWPPVLLPHGTTHATAGTGVDASKLGTARAAKRSLQITYAGHRLYWSVKDKTARQVHSDVTTRWGRWSTVTVASTSATTMPAPTTAAPVTDAPATAPPATAPPATMAPPTAPPETAPPATDPPQTSPPTAPPTTQPKSNPGNGGVGF